jgi:hypothetical protein
MGAFLTLTSLGRRRPGVHEFRKMTGENHRQ